MVARPLEDDLFHSVLEGQLALLEGGFFDLLGFGEVGSFVEFVEAMVENVVPFGQFTVLIVALQQEVLDLLRFRDVHGRTLLSGTNDAYCHGQGNTSVVGAQSPVPVRVPVARLGSRQRIRASSTGFV